MGRDVAPGRRMAQSGDISVNRKALHDFHIIERFEAGLALKGTEVKSIRAGFANVNQAFARIEDGEAWLYEADIQPYERASFEQHEPRRRRKLLLHRQELDRLFGLVSVKGHTLVALRLYWKQSRVKVELGVGKGKEARDKRADIKKRVDERETAREMARFNRRHR
jgi:SsrA-binding protein